VNRLKRLMSSLISNNQSSFVPGRHVVDNIIYSLSGGGSLYESEKGKERINGD